MLPSTSGHNIPKTIWGEKTSVKQSHITPHSMYFHAIINIANIYICIYHHETWKSRMICSIRGCHRKRLWDGCSTHHTPPRLSTSQINKASLKQIEGRRAVSGVQGEKVNMEIKSCATKGPWHHFVSVLDIAKIFSTKGMTNLPFGGPLIYRDPRRAYHSK